jgi:uncharacterized protein (DUF1330 family)
MGVMNASVLGCPRQSERFRVEYKKYNGSGPAIIEQYGGKVLARGGRFQINEGPSTFNRFVVIEFPTLEAGVACFQSPEYQEAAKFRRATVSASSRTSSSRAAISLLRSTKIAKNAIRANPGAVRGGSDPCAARRHDSRR